MEKKKKKKETAYLQFSDDALQILADEISLLIVDRTSKILVVYCINVLTEKVEACTVIVPRFVLKLLSQIIYSCTDRCWKIYEKKYLEKLLKIISFVYLYATHI